MKVGLAPSPIADALPDIAFQDQRAITRRLSDWKGRPLLVNFWATWCEPCRRRDSVPGALAADERAGDGLQVIGIAVDSRAAVLDYARRAGIEYPLLIGEQGGLAGGTGARHGGGLPVLGVRRSAGAHRHAEDRRAAPG